MLQPCWIFFLYTFCGLRTYMEKIVKIWGERCEWVICLFLGTGIEFCMKWVMLDDIVVLTITKSCSLVEPLLLNLDWLMCKICEGVLMIYTSGFADKTWPWTYNVAEMTINIDGKCIAFELVVFLQWNRVMCHKEKFAFYVFCMQFVLYPLL